MKLSLLFFLGFFLTSCASSPFPHLNFKDWGRTPECCQAKGSQLGIASGGTYSSKAGLSISNQGGNIVDAAIATAFTLAVERPQSLGIGGGGFFLLSLKETQFQKAAQVFVDFRETAPALASKNMFLDSEGNPIPDKSRLGALAIATPGFVPGLFLIHQRWGKLPWKKLLEPAIDLAKKGFPIYLSLAKSIDREKDILFKEAYTKSLLSKGDRALSKGDILKQPDLARTLERIGENPKELTSGFTAKTIAQFVQSQNGILTLADLGSYKPKIRKPLEWRWKEKTFLFAPPPSAGGVLFIQLLQMLEQDALPVLEEATYFHLLAECMKRAYADRSQVIGDPDFSKLPLKEVLDRNRVLEQRKLISLDTATPSASLQAFQFSPKKDTHTSHLSIVDFEGNAVAMTLSLNDHFGSRLAVPGTGVFLNDQMDDFSAKPGEANLFGLVGAEANSIAPLKRPASSMSPTIVLSGGRAILATGAAGGSRIPSNVFQVLVNIFQRPKGDLRRAVFWPRIHHQWNPDELSVEKGLDQKIADLLKSKGHKVVEGERVSRVESVFRDSHGSLEAVFDPRDEGGAEAK